MLAKPKAKYKTVSRNLEDGAREGKIQHIAGAKLQSLDAAASDGRKSRLIGRDESVEARLGGVGRDDGFEAVGRTERHVSQF